MSDHKRCDRPTSFAVKGEAEFPSAAERWVQEQMFEEDVRAVLKMMRPHRRERLEAWSEYRTGGASFRVTISWDREFEREQEISPEAPARDGLAVPQLARVLETILVGSARNGDDLTPREEFALYRSVAEELARRLDELENCYT